MLFINGSFSEAGVPRLALYVTRMIKIVKHLSFNYHLSAEDKNLFGQILFQVVEINTEKKM